MSLHTWIDGDVVILSNFGRLMNDPRHFDAAQTVGELLDQGYRRFIFELADVQEMGPPAFGLLTTLTRLVEKRGGEAVLARLSRPLRDYIGMMQMDAYWETFPDVERARRFFRGTPG